VAEAAGVAVYPAGMPGESSIMGAAQVHFASTLARLPLGTAIAPHYVKGDIVANPIRPRDGAFDVPDGPGLGVAPDEAALRVYARR
jgi:L-alanine-DL-glutamate epimerase-like enolase superfamily enzyme